MFYSHASRYFVLFSASDQERQQTEPSWFTFPENLQTSNIEKRCKERTWQISLDQNENSAGADHGIKTGYCICFNVTSILDGKSGYMDRLVKEAIEIRMKNYFNGGSGFILSRPSVL